jgi:hypothetical protein
MEQPSGMMLIPRAMKTFISIQDLFIWAWRERETDTTIL